MVSKKELLSKLAVEKRLTALYLKRITCLRAALHHIQKHIDTEEISDKIYFGCKEIIRKALVITV